MFPSTIMDPFINYVGYCAHYVGTIIPLSMANSEMRGSTLEREWDWARLYQIWKEYDSPFRGHWTIQVSNARRFLGRPVHHLNKPGSHGFDTLLRQDLFEMSSKIRRLMTSTPRGQILSLPGHQLLSLMDVLQTLIDCKYDNNGDLQKILHYIVRNKDLLPSYLFLSDIRPVGRDPFKGGRYADVWRAQDGEQCLALKVLREFESDESEREKLVKAFRKEAMIWRQFNHNNLLPFYGICDFFSPRLAMVSPWMKNGDLTTFLKHNDYTDRLETILAVAEGLKYLHTFLRDTAYVHGDLRAGNVFVDDYNNPRIADFGFTRLMDPQATLPSLQKGNVRWLGPELLDPSQFQGVNGHSTTMSDVYAFACLCLEVFSGQFPFQGKIDAVVIHSVVVKRQHPPHPQQPAIRRGLDDVIWKMMRSCWKQEPTHRPDITTVVQIIRSCL